MVTLFNAAARADSSLRGLFSQSAFSGASIIMMRASLFLLQQSALCCRNSSMVENELCYLYKKLI